MRKMGLNIPFLIFTTHHSGRLETDVRQAGAQGYVLKSQAAHHLVQAIDTVLAGGTFFGAPPKPERAEGTSGTQESGFVAASLLQSEPRQAVQSKDKWRTGTAPPQIKNR
jgi:DNA-binding NarL/FixJ family response regulator